jgi:hypothetical protein
VKGETVEFTLLEFIVMMLSFAAIGFAGGWMAGYRTAIGKVWHVQETQGPEEAPEVSSEYESWWKAREEADRQKALKLGKEIQMLTLNVYREKIKELEGKLEGVHKHIEARVKQMNASMGERLDSMEKWVVSVGGRVRKLEQMEGRINAVEVRQDRQRCRMNAIVARLEYLEVNQERAEKAVPSDLNRRMDKLTGDIEKILHRLGSTELRIDAHERASLQTPWMIRTMGNPISQHMKGDFDPASLSREREPAMQGAPETKKKAVPSDYDIFSRYRVMLESYGPQKAVFFTAMHYGIGHVEVAVALRRHMGI